MTPTNKAAAMANLARMGYSPSKAACIASDWMEYQSAYSLHSVTKVGSSANPIFESGMDVDVGGKLFMSCHYGSYPHVVFSIARRAKERTIYVLIGSESQSLTEALESRAREKNITIKFIDGGFGMVKRIKRALSDNFPVFVEIDVPWGPSQECNVAFPFVGGTLKGKDALFRLADRLAVEKNFVLSSVGKRTISVVNFGDLSQSECHAIFADAVQNSPHLYERLFQLHQYFEPDIESETAVVWQGDKGQYILHARDMKAWCTPHQLLGTHNLKDSLEQIIGRKVGDVVSI